MCTGNAESRQILNGGEVVVISKVERMRDRDNIDEEDDEEEDDDDDNNNNIGEGFTSWLRSKSGRFFHGLFQHISAQLPTISLSEVSLYVSLWFSII